MPKGANTAGSPTAEDVKPEERADLAASTALESSTSHDDNAAPSAEPSDASSEGAAAKPDASKPAVSPLDELRSRKVGNDAAAAGDEPAADEAQDGDEPAAVDEEPAASDVADEDVPAKPEAAKGKPAAATDKPGDANEDPLHTLSPEARAHIGREASARIRELNTKWRDAEKARKGDEPLVRGGRILQRYLTDREVPMTPQETIQALEFAKAYKRGDENALVMLRESVAEIEDRLGVQSAPAADEIEPFEGELPSSMQNLIDYGADEQEVRLLHSVRVRRAERAKLAKAGGAQGQPVQRQQPQRQAPQPQQRQPAATPQVNRYGHSIAEAGLAGDAVMTYLRANNIPDAEMEKYFDAEILPRIQKHCQNGDIESIAPENRLRFVEIAHKAAVIEKRQKAAALQARPRPVSGGTSPTPQTTSQRQSGAMTPLQQLRAKKVGR